MSVTHIVPINRGRRLQHVLDETKQQGEVLVFPDDLTFGPIAGDVTKTRTSVKTDVRDPASRSEQIAAFWRHLEQDDRPVTIWFGRHSADELAMLLMLCERLEDRHLSVIDVTNLSVQASWNGASPAIPPPQGVQDVPGSVLRLLASKQLPLEPALRKAYAARWRLLQAENAVARVIGADGLRSAALEEFDSCLFEALSNDWRRTAWVINAAERFASRQYRQIGRSGLLTRAGTLVAQGTLEAHGDVWDLWDDDECALRLPATGQTPAGKAKILHVASHPSFAGNLIGCLQRASLDEDVLGFPDELSAGPIVSDEVSIRAEWWRTIARWPDHGSIAAFWRDVAAGPPLVVWFSRREARDQCLYFALCDRFPDRIAAIGDVSTVSVKYEWMDGTFVEAPSPQNVHGVAGDVLASLLALTTRPDPIEIAANAKRWRELKAENAPFRVISEGGLLSQEGTYFDHMILGAATMDWHKTIRVVGEALARLSCNTVHQYVILSRVVALVEAGALEAEGDPCLWHDSRIRLSRST